MVDKHLESNELVVAQGHDHPRLMSDGLEASGAHWIAGTPGLPLECTAKVRYRMRDVACRVEALAGDRVRVRFATPQRAVTPGQSVVFYAGDECLGGAVIERTEINN